MSDLFEILACELKKNNVSIEIHRVVSPNLLAIGENIVEEKIILDFSKHDKVFEDKISELKEKIAIKDMDYKTASELLGKYQQENESLKKRIIELEDFSCQVEQETESLVEKLNQRIDELEKELEEWKEEAKVVKKQRDEQLKSFRKGIEPYVDLLHMHETIAELNQRIAELESRKTERFDKVPDSITIDGYKCKIINTERGLYISRDEIYSIIDKEKEPLKQKCKELEDRHQSDCIEINRLNTTIDVLIHKVEYLRQFAGLE